MSDKITIGYFYSNLDRQCEKIVGRLQGVPESK